MARWGSLEGVTDVLLVHQVLAVRHHASFIICYGLPCAIAQPWNGTPAANSHFSVTKSALFYYSGWSISVPTVNLLFWTTVLFIREESVRIHSNTLNFVPGCSLVFLLFWWAAGVFLRPQLRATWRPTSIRANWCRRTCRWPRNCRRRRITGPKCRARNSILTCKCQTHTNIGHW